MRVRELTVIALLVSLSATAAFSRGISTGPDLVTGATVRPVRRIADADLASLSAGDVVFIIDAWVTPTGVTQKLMEFVERGGQIVIFDAPRKCISDPAMQRLTGFGDGATFHRTEHAVLHPVGDSSLVPTGGIALAAEEIEQIDADWLAYRTRGVTDLVRLVNQNVRSERPELPLSAFVWADADIARDNYAQDWAGWLQTGIIDFVKPMAYTTDDAALRGNLEHYAEIDPAMVRIIPALSLYQRSEGKQVPRPPEMVLGQIDLVREAGARGVGLFANAHLSDEVLAALTEGPFREPASPYLPGMSTAE